MPFLWIACGKVDREFSTGVKNLSDGINPISRVKRACHPHIFGFGGPIHNIHRLYCYYESNNLLNK
jgi:hypothetical protein